MSGDERGVRVDGRGTVAQVRGSTRHGLVAGAGVHATTSAVRSRPILFTPLMSKKTRQKAKTQTRRLLKHPEYYGCPTGDCPHSTQGECNQAMNSPEVLAECPFGKPGDVLWVRESWYYDLPPHTLPSVKPADFEPDSLYFRADGECCEQIPECSCAEVGKPRWRTGMFLPRWASRTTLELVRRRLEIVQDITEADASAEGFASRDEFLKYFYGINRRAPRNVPLWVWVIDYKMIEVAR